MEKTVEELKAEIVALQNENNTLKNKETGVEAERAKNTELKKQLGELKTQITTLEVKLEEAKTQGANDANSFKSLYEEKKTEAENLKAQITTKDSELEELKTLKEAQEAKISADIETLFEGVPEDQKEMVKDMASKYPLEERVGFITNFTKQFIGKSKRQGGRPNGDQGEGKTGKERAQETYDLLKAKPYRTEAEKKQFIKLGKILTGEIEIDD